MKNDLKERYLYAVTKRLSPKIREDVSLELQSLMEDMLLERCGEAQPTQEDIKAVIRELGSPAELYAKYADDADTCLIGQPYYSSYKLLMKIVLCSVAAALVVSVILTQIINPKPLLPALSFLMSTEIDGLLSAFGIVTLIFAVLSHRKANMDALFDLDDLPPVPKKKSRISIWDSIFEIVFHMVFLIVFLGVPQMFSAKIDDLWIPCFNVQVIRNNWYLLVLFTLAGVLREAVKLMERRYNRRVLGVTLAADLVSAGIAVFWLSGPQIVNSDLITALNSFITQEKAFVIHMFGQFNLFLLGCILLALILDVATALYKCER